MNNKNFYLFGSNNTNDCQIEHGSVGKQHAAIYFSQDMETILVDLNTTHGTRIIRGGS